MDLPVSTSRTRGDFFVAPSNALAFETVTGAQDWPGGRLLLIGGAGAGKSHLAQIWAEQAGARIVTAGELEGAPAGAAPGGPVVVEDADAIAGQAGAEEALFHLYNTQAAAGQRLLITARGPVRDWGLGLADLASRLQSMAVARLEPPDEALLSMVLLKLFADRQIEVSPALIAWLVARMERSLACAGRLVARLDRAAMAEKRPITRSFAARVLDFDA